MAHSIPNRHSTLSLRTEEPNSLALETSWLREVQSAERSNLQATARWETRQNRMAPNGATVEALTALEAATAAAVAAAQRALSFAAVLDEALAVLADAGRPHTARPRSRDAIPGIAGLSPREREVLALVAKGHTNKAIADLLYVSPNTVKTHVASLLAKLQAESRAELAAIAVRQVPG